MPGTRPAFAVSLSPTATYSRTAPEAYGKMDAVKIDLKSFSESYYAKVVTGQLKPVLDTLVTLRKMGKWTRSSTWWCQRSTTAMRNSAAWRNGSKPIWARMSRCTSHSFIPIPVEESAHHAGTHAGARQGDRRRRGPSFRLIGNVPGHPAQNTYCRNVAKCLWSASALRPALCSSARMAPAHSAGI